MPVNRNALIRYRTIDHCLRNKYRKYTLEDLIDACSEALYEYEGIEKGVSKRTIQMDIQLMRSDKLGYNAPIIVEEKKYYRYEDASYSITNIPLTGQDLGKLTEVVEILKQFKGFSHFSELSGMVQRLENKIYSAKTNTEPIIDFEKNEGLKGLEHIDTLYQAIVKKSAVFITYQSFKARSAQAFDFHPYFLKEYRNRWFILGLKKRNTPFLTLALDRIVDITSSVKPYIPKPKDLTPSEYFKDALGVSVSPGAKIEKVILWADNQTAPYIITKPVHDSQVIEERDAYGVTFSIRVQLNFELEREILGFGQRVKVIAPERLKQRIKSCLSDALDLYQFELNDNALAGGLHKFYQRGFLLLNNVFSRKEVNLIKVQIDRYLKEQHPETTHAIRNVLKEIPELLPMVLNANVTKVLKKINRKFFISKAIFFDKTPESNWYVTWHQDITIHVEEKKETEGFTGWTKKDYGFSVCPPEEILKDTITIRIHLDNADESNGALKVIPGSQNKKMSDDEIQLITQNCIPHVCSVNAGGIHMMKPLLLHASSKATTPQHRRVLHLEFNTIDLPKPLQWAEKVDLPDHL